MQKVFSNRKFINKFNSWLPINLDDSEGANILKDYHKVNKKESLQRKSENEILVSLKEPIKEVKNLSTETSIKSSLIAIPFNNVIFQVFLLTIIRLILELIVFKVCNDYSKNYIYFAFIINFIYCIVGMQLIKELNFKPKFHYYKVNLLILSLAVMTILTEIFVMPKLDFSFSGGICALVIYILSFVMFIMSIYFVLFKIVENKQYSFMTIMNLLGLITLFLFIINQLHMFYYSRLEYINFVYGSIGIYAETIALCFIFYIGRIYRRKK